MLGAASFFGPAIAFIIIFMQARGACAAAAPQPDTLTDRHIETAIEAIQHELLRRRHRQTLWEPRPWNPRNDGSPSQAGGYTALVAFALIESGISYQDPRLDGVIDRIIAADAPGMYTVAVRTMLFARLPESFTPHLERETRTLIEGFSIPAVSWTYESRPQTTRRDNSLRQFGALALRDAVRRGMPVSERFWMMLEQALLECQLPCGGWNYEANAAPPRGSMTAGSIATLAICDEILRRQRAVRHDPSRQAATASAIERGLQWLEEHFQASAHPGHPGYFTYWAYGVERAALAAGRRTIGGHDWFRVLASELLARFVRFDPETATATIHQRQYGAGNRAVVRTDDLAFTLLFLARGRVFVAINKLEIPGIRWNNRPHDALGMSEHLSETVLQTRGWQIVHAHDEPQSWLDAALLYIASDQALPLHDAVPSAEASDTTLATQIGRYLDAGGLLLAAADAGSALADSVERMGSLLYPHLTWRTLAADDPLLSIRRRADNAGPVRALGNGVRDLIVLVSRGDLPASFQGRRTAAPTPRQRAHADLLENVYVIATEMDRPPGRLAASQAFAGADARIAAESAGSSALLLLEALPGGRPAPEPAALRRFAARERAAGRMINVMTAALDDRESLRHVDPDLVVISGTDWRGITPAEREMLHDLLSRTRATFLIETTGGRGDFAARMEQELESMLSVPARRLRDDIVITGEGLPGGTSLRRCGWRPFTLEQHRSLPAEPRLRGIDIAGRLRIIISEDDCMHALLRRPWWGVSGYVADDAEAIVRNLLLMSRHHDGPGTPAADDIGDR